ncbi:MAG: hypothetical protein IJC62_01095, partial [Clostridia bacterium]|nr:hypothetical protein [Clostridia bacterium]
RTTGLYPVYPDHKFGTIAAWVWGYQRCIDVLETIPEVDMSCICISGQSRGGKGTLLAGASDERIAFTHASCSGMFGAGSFRYTQMPGKLVDVHDVATVDTHSETLGNMFALGVEWDIGFWFGEDMRAYISREDELPFDLHSLKALIAPRGLLETSSVDDTWGNPRGCYQTFRAAREVYKFLGAEDSIASVYRYGAHGCWTQDLIAFIDFVDDVRAGRQYLHNNADNVYGSLPQVYDWN